MAPLVLAALTLTLVVEVPIVAIIFKAQWVRMALVCAITTGLTNLFMNTLLRFWIADFGVAISIGELGAFTIEALIYSLLSKPRDIPRALLASAVANAASYSAGMLI